MPHAKVSFISCSRHFMLSKLCLMYGCLHIKLRRSHDCFFPKLTFRLVLFVFVTQLRHHAMLIRGRPWRYSIIPSTPDFPMEYQIRRNSNPAGLPVFAAVWGPNFRASTIILTHMFNLIKQIKITLIAKFKVNPGFPVHQMKYR